MNAAHSDGQKEEGSCPRTPQPGQVLPTWTGISCGHPRSDFPSLGLSCPIRPGRGLTVTRAPTSPNESSLPIWMLGIFLSRWFPRLQGSVGCWIFARVPSWSPVNISFILSQSLPHAFYLGSLSFPSNFLPFS